MSIYKLNTLVLPLLDQNIGECQNLLCTCPFPGIALHPHYFDLNHHRLILPIFVHLNGNRQINKMYVNSLLYLTL